MNSSILLFLFLLLMKNKDNKNHMAISTGGPIDINIPHTLEKIRVVKKIAPYLPEELLPSINKALVVTEKFIKLYEAMEFVQHSDDYFIKERVKIESNKERLNYIANAIQEEISKGNLKHTSKTFETILNLDKYNKMLTIISSIMANPDSFNNPDGILKVLEPLLPGKEEEKKKKIKDMANMLEIIKRLDGHKKTEGDGRAKDRD
ncbi:MAG: hypothetical protein GXY88_07295 [Tissierellia bacterium]|nr:hypothetical protein [Tissierellia bacterium]